MGMLVSEFSTSNSGATGAASTDRTTYQTSDKLGTAVLLMAASGLVIENNRTLPYGEEWLPAAGSANEQKFTSYQRDGESGLDYAMNRYHSGAFGRFRSPDPLEVPSDFLATPTILNRYIYSLADPINNIDPDGLIPRQVFECSVGPEGQENCRWVIRDVPGPDFLTASGFDDLGYIDCVVDEWRMMNSILDTVESGTVVAEVYVIALNLISPIRTLAREGFELGENLIKKYVIDIVKRQVKSAELEIVADGLNEVDLALGVFENLLYDGFLAGVDDCFRVASPSEEALLNIR